MDGFPGRDRVGASLRFAAATTARSSVQIAQLLWSVARCSAAFALKMLWVGLRLLFWVTREFVKLIWEHIVHSQPPGPLQPPPPRVQAAAHVSDLPVSTDAEEVQDAFCQETEKCAETRELEDDHFEAFEALCQRTEESATLPEAEDSSTEMPTFDATELFSSGDASCGLFTLRFKVRDAWDRPEDDELLDASLVNEWIDLGSCTDAVNNSDAAAPNPKAVNEEGDEEPPGVKKGQENKQEEGEEVKKEEEEEGRNESDMGNKKGLLQSQAAAPADHSHGLLSPRSVLRSQLQQVLPPDADVNAYVDIDGSSSDGQAHGGMICLTGPLRSEAWETACRSALGCEACGVYLSGCYDAIFSNPAPDLVQPLEDQVACALGHWSGHRANLVLEDAAFAGFESLAINVAAVLRGEAPPGWHRLEWTPHGNDAMSHMTY